MKKHLSLLLVFALAVLPCHAVIKQVTNVGASASTIITPGRNVKVLVIQNNGSGDVRLAIDGGTTTNLTDPTASTGYLLKAGTQLILTYPGSIQAPKIRAILVTGTTTVLDICTDEDRSS
jgi:hypothetical protein